MSSAKREFPIYRREIELTLRQKKKIENVILIKEKAKRASFGVFEIAMRTEVFW